MSTTRIPSAPAPGAANERSLARNGAHPATVVPRNGWYGPIKFVAEYLLALILFAIALPVLAVAALLVKLTSRGPAFYLQTRLGRNGRAFRVIKLRTMVNNAEAMTGPVWAGPNDPRITRLGRLLRNLHIDEFPQLVNVLLGQMSLVGPRPERPEIVDQLEWQVSNYRQRLQVRPGITGLAQLKLPPDTCIDSVRRKLLHDLYYVRCAGPWLDLRILCATGWLLLRKIIRGLWNLIALPSTEKVSNGLEPIVGRESDLIFSVRNGRPE